MMLHAQIKIKRKSESEKHITRDVIIVRLVVWLKWEGIISYASIAAVFG